MCHTVILIRVAAPLRAPCPSFPIDLKNQMLCSYRSRVSKHRRSLQKQLLGGARLLVPEGATSYRGHQRRQRLGWRMSLEAGPGTGPCSGWWEGRWGPAVLVPMLS